LLWVKGSTLYSGSGEETVEHSRLNNKPIKPMSNFIPSKKISRRHFLNRTAQVAAAGVAMPYFIPSGVLAAEGRPGANDRIGIGIIGMGRQAGDLLRGLSRHGEARLVAVADVHLGRAEAVGAKHSAAALQDYRKLLDRKDVDAIISATPDHWRSLTCIEACQAGKDVYAEKPLTLTIREGRLMVDAARKHGRVFQTGSQQRSMWPNHAGCQLVRSGAIGRIQRVIAQNYASPWECALPAQPIPEGLDWDFWCGPNELVPYHQDLFLPRANPGWISFRAYSGGEMAGWGSHGFDQVQCALGMDASGPIEIWTEGSRFDPPTYAAPESRARGDKLCAEPKVFFRYPGDIIMELANGPAGGAVFIGEKGKVTIDRNRFESDPPELAQEALRNRPAQFGDNHMKNWLDCIKSRGTPVADVEIGHRTATVCHLGNIARWTGRKLRWDPVKEIFPDDADANQHLDRPRRKPYELPKAV
jgi:predicted dehydrogenase